MPSHARPLAGPAAALAAFLILFGSFAFDAFRLLGPERLQQDFTSKALVMGRILQAEQHGLLAARGRLGLMAEREGEGWSNAMVARQNALWASPGRGAGQPWWEYPSQPGIHGVVLSALYLHAPFGLLRGLDRLEWLMAAASALAVAALAAQLRALAGWMAAAGLVAVFATAPWMIAYARHLYWALPAQLLILVAALHYAGRVRPAAGRAGVPAGPAALLALAFFVKFACGFEYTTVLALGAMAMLAFRAALDRWGMAATLRHLVVVGGMSVAGFLLAIGLHLLQEPSLAWLAHRFEVRALGTPEQLIPGAGAVLRRYLLLPMGFKDQPPFWIALAALVLLSAGTLLAAWRWRLPRQLPALAVLALAGLLGPLSWFVVALPHAFHHPHINPYLWYVPALPAAGALAGAWLGWLGRRGPAST